MIICGCNMLHLLTIPLHRTNNVNVFEHPGILVYTETPNTVHLRRNKDMK